MDNLPPVIMGCPTKSPVTINLGQGSVKPVGMHRHLWRWTTVLQAHTFGNRNTTTVCLPPASYWSITGEPASWG
ncbi:MAG: hypothetical protein IPG87_08430 [Saprospiraceae bacterium]|nr:hypothetical protein [Candidatus Vicinibacter affinis]